MAERERSLRRVVEAWLGPAAHVRVTRCVHPRRKLCRYVRVEAVRDKATLVIVFFGHHDGCWCVFPPAPRNGLGNGHPCFAAAVHCARMRSVTLTNSAKWRRTFIMNVELNHSSAFRIMLQRIRERLSPDCNDGPIV